MQIEARDEELRPGAQESLFLDEHAAWKGSEMKRTDDVTRERVQKTARPYLDLGFDLTSEPDASLLPLLLDAKNEFDFSLPGLATRPLPAKERSLSLCARGHSQLSDSPLLDALT